jgi:HSP20 family protein
MSRLVRWNPWTPSNVFNELMDRPFRTMFDEPFSIGEGMAMDVSETDNAYHVETELPGVDPEHIHVRIEDNLLTIEGEIPEHEVEHDDTRHLIRERRYGRFSRSVRLPQSVDSNNVDATYNNGILELDIAKLPEKQSKRIEVKVLPKGK